MESPATPIGKDANISEGLAQSACNSGQIFLITNGQPLLQDSSGTQPLADHRIEISGIEQTRTGRLNRRRGIDRDHVVSPIRSFQVAAAIIYHDVRKR